jgi:thioester reductase-like protein
MADHFLITGGTGMIGQDLLPRLLRRFPGSTLTLLVRASSDEDLHQRMRPLIQAVSGRVADASGRIRGVRGDTLQQWFGIDPKERDRIVRDTTYFIHGAATIRFDHPIDEAREINCGGTTRALAIAQECVDRGRLKRLVYLGTSSVSGQRGGVILESQLEMNQKYFNTYEQSKCESERLVRDYFDRIPAVVFRPSIVIGDSLTGYTPSFNVIYTPLRLVQRGLLSFVPGSEETLLDLVPVDWVNEVMAHIMGMDEANGKVCHVTAGPGRAAPLGEVVLAALEYFERHTPMAKPRTMEFISREEFELRRSTTRGREEALMSQLDTLLPYVSVNRLFDSRTTDRLLEGSGIVFPRYADYQEKILGYCLASQWGKKEVEHGRR